MQGDKQDFVVRAKLHIRGEWRPASITVEKDHIASIAELEDGGERLYEPLELGDAYLMPGLVDAHTHIAMNAINLQDAIASWDNKEATREHIALVMQRFLAAGVTHVRDGGDAAGISLMARRMEEDEGIPGPATATCGYALYKKGRYGDFLGPGITDLEEGFRQIDEIAGYADHLKICQSGIVSFKTYGHVGAAQFSLEELSRLVDYAHNKGLPVMAHASGTEAVDIAVRARVDTVEHGYYALVSTIELMAELGTVWVPTLSPLANLLKHPDLMYPGTDADIIRRAVDDQKAKLKFAHTMGVRIAVGTDAGAVAVPHGASIYDEIEHMVSTGISREEVFKMACLEARRVLGVAIPTMSDSLSGWQTGDEFDAVVYKRNPFENAVGVEDIMAVYF